MDPLSLPQHLRERRHPDGYLPGGGQGRREFLLALGALLFLVLMAAARVNHPVAPVDRAARSLATTLHSAQHEAMIRRHDMVIAFDQSQRRAVVLYDVNGNGMADPDERVRTVPLDDAVVFGRGLAPARAMGAAVINFGRTINGLPGVIFHRDGSASASGGVYLTSAQAQADAAYPRDTRAIEVGGKGWRAVWWRYTGDGWTPGNSVTGER